MKCVVVGSSPNVEELGHVVDDHDVVIRTGYGTTRGFENLVGSRTDILVTRTNKFNHNNKFKFQVNIPEYNKPVPKEIIFLSNNKLLNLQPSSLLLDVDKEARLNNNEKPTLGLIAIVYAIKLYNNVKIHGVETQIYSRYHSHGHIEDVNYRRNNMYHSLIKEVIYYNKMIRRGIITKI